MARFYAPSRAKSSEADIVDGAKVGVNPRQGGTGFGLEALQGLGILWGRRAGLRPYGLL
jgi:hypothetical protein